MGGHGANLNVSGKHGMKLATELLHDFSSNLFCK